MLVFPPSLFLFTSPPPPPRNFIARRKEKRGKGRGRRSCLIFFRVRRGGRRHATLYSAAVDRASSLPRWFCTHSRTGREGGNQCRSSDDQPRKKKEAEKSQAKQAKKENSLLLLPFPRKSFENPYFHYVFTTYYVSGVRACGGGGRPWEGRGDKSENVHTAAEVSFFFFSSFSLFFAGKRFIFRSPHCCKYWYEDVRYGPAVHMKSEEEEEEESPLGLVPISVFSSSSF